MQLLYDVGSDDGVQYKVFGACSNKNHAVTKLSQVEVILLKGEKRERGKIMQADINESLARETNSKELQCMLDPLLNLF